MKVLMVADARSVHTRRWAVSLQERGIGIVLFSLYPSPDNFFAEKDIALHVFDLFTYKQYRGIRALTGMLSGHAAAVSQLKKLIRNESPDILHAHYVTSFGLVAALAGFRPFLVSVWGSDVYEFPDSSLINRLSVNTY